MYLLFWPRSQAIYLVIYFPCNLGT